MKPSLLIVSVASLALAPDTRAWSGHYLVVQAGGPFQAESTSVVTSHLQSGYVGSEFVSAFASGALSVDVAGVSAYEFTSPTFLTAPEPSDTALAAKRGRRTAS